MRITLAEYSAAAFNVGSSDKAGAEVLLEILAHKTG
jgi:hypothetical protein